MKIKIAITSFLLLVILSGCSISFGEKKTGNTINPNTDGGVFVSADKGSNWKQMSLMPNIKGAPGNINSVSSYGLSMDPNDSKAVYLGTISSGLYYTYNVSEGWFKSESLPLSGVKSVAVDPKNKCTIYASGGNKLFRTDDCSRNWSQVYYDNDLSVSINVVSVDHYNTDIIYIGTQRGDILKSSDKGESWQPIFRGKGPITKIALSPFDSQIIFIGMSNRGTARSFDGGLTWFDLEENLKDFKNSQKFIDFSIASDKEGVVYMATIYGLIKSTDYGDTWARVDLLTPEKDSTINSLAIGPNSDEIYYVTDTTFYRSSDGGISWTTIKLPSTRSGQDVLISPDNPDIIYLCVKQIKKR